MNMNTNVDVLAVMDRAITRNIDKGAAKGSPSDKELREARAAVAELIEAAESLRARLILHGDWEDTCFYYNGYSAPELMAPMAELDEALARVKGA